MRCTEVTKITEMRSCCCDSDKGGEVKCCNCSINLIATFMLLLEFILQFILLAPRLVDIKVQFPKSRRSYLSYNYPCNVHLNRSKFIFIPKLYFVNLFAKANYYCSKKLFFYYFLFY